MLSTADPGSKLGQNNQDTSLKLNVSFDLIEQSIPTLVKSYSPVLFRLENATSILNLQNKTTTVYRTW